MTQGIDPSFALPIEIALVVIPDARPFGWIQASGLQGKASSGKQRQWASAQSLSQKRDHRRRRPIPRATMFFKNHGVSRLLRRYPPEPRLQPMA